MAFIHTKSAAFHHHRLLETMISTYAGHNCVLRVQDEGEKESEIGGQGWWGEKI
jgi:phosphatidate phosphatase APP1